MKGFRGIAFRIWLCAAIGQILALVALFGTLENVRLRESASQLDTMVGRVLGQASARAALGYPLEYQADLQTLIDDLTRTARRGADIYILDDAGVIIFASEQARIGTTAPQAWLGAGAGTDRWATTTDVAAISGAEIVNAFGARSGTVVARALRATVLADVVASLRTPMLAGLGALCLVGVLVVLGGALAARPIARRLDELEARYRHAAAAVREGRPVEADEAGRSIRAARAAVAALDAIERRAAALDRLNVTPPGRRDSATGSGRAEHGEKAA